MVKNTFCWICARDGAKTPCIKCFRNYHINCVERIPDVGPLLERRKGLKKFIKPCPECIAITSSARRWTDPKDFEMIDRGKLNSLLLYILDYLRPSAPEPFLWPVDRFSNCPKPYDMDKIKEKATQNRYNCPKEFFADIKVIHHNCMLMVKNRDLLSVDGSTFNLLQSNKPEILKFKNSIEQKLSYLEDCPHCVSNRKQSKDNWLTMTCPWGHPLIQVWFDGALWPAKLIKYHRSSDTVSCNLFGTGMRISVKRSTCESACSADLKRETCKKELTLARSQAKQYVEELKNMFGDKFILPKERRKLIEADKDFIFKRSHPQANGNKNKRKGDKRFESVNRESKTQKDVNNGADTSSINVNEKVIQSKKQTDVISPSPDSNLNGSKEESRENQPTIQCINIDSDCSDSSSALEDVKAQSPVHKGSNTEELTVDENQENLDSQPFNKNIDNQYTEVSPSKKLAYSSISNPEFSITVDDDEQLNDKLQPIQPWHLVVTENEKIIFESTSLNSMDLDLPFLENGSNSEDGPVKKRFKLDSTLLQLPEIVKIKERLVLLEKERDLCMRQIDDLTNQSRLTQQIAETNLKSAELTFEMELKKLQDELATVKEEKENLTSKMNQIEKDFQPSIVQKLNQLDLYWKNKLCESIKAKDEQHREEITVKEREKGLLALKLSKCENENTILTKKYDHIRSEFLRFRSNLLNLISTIPSTDEDQDAIKI